MFLVTKLGDFVEPHSTQEAMKTKHWFAATEKEINALQRNWIWVLVIFSPSHNLVGNKWVFKVKHNVEGSV